MTMHEHAQLIVATDPFGTAIVIAGAIATLLAIVLAFRMTVWPGEEAEDHPKRVILREDR
jgi:hypothetical protein